MKGIIVTVGTGLLVMVPAAIGLVGNTSFAQSVPVRVPPQATLVSDSGHERGISTAEPGDDKGGQHSVRTQSPSDDKGGQSGFSTASPGDDRGSHGRRTPTLTHDQNRTSSFSTPATAGARVQDSGSGKGQNGGGGGTTSQSGGKDDSSGHK